VPRADNLTIFVPQPPGTLKAFTGIAVIQVWDFLVGIIAEIDHKNQLQGLRL
jgi:hypothetical protein